MSTDEQKKGMPYFPRSYGSGIRKAQVRETTESKTDLETPSGEDVASGGHVDRSADRTSEDHCEMVFEDEDSPLSAGEELDLDVGTVPGPASRDGGGEGPTPSDITSGHREQRAEERPSEVLVKIVGVRFNYAGKIYHFDAGDLELSAHDWVIVKTEKGMGLGQVVTEPVEYELSWSEAEGLRRIIRKAGKVDFDQKSRSVQREAQAKAFCLERIETLNLSMKLVDVECFFDGGKYVFYFTAEGRVDFRELVKQLVARFPVRIEMRQIGVRHEAKMTGGLACCGQELCCARFLTDFRPVSVRMAKNQNLSLNPTKISGVCGRLMCCLAYENEIYEEFKKGIPRVGKAVHTPKGDGVILKHNPLTRTVLVKLQDETTVEMSKEEFLQSLGYHADGRDVPPDSADEEASAQGFSETDYGEEPVEEGV